MPAVRLVAGRLRDGAATLAGVPSCVTPWTSRARCGGAASACSQCPARGPVPSLASPATARCRPSLGAEYTAYLARVLEVEPARMTFYRAPVLLNAAGLRAIGQTVTEGGYGLVLIASWQAVVRGLVKDENDNAGAVQVVEGVKAFTRQSGVPWLIDAHSGKGEDQADDAGPSKAMRGASGAAGAADYTLSLRYTNGAFGTQRRFSGKGRFVNFPPLTIDLDPEAGSYTLIGATKQAAADTTWRVICDLGALNGTPQSVTDIARTIGVTGKVGGQDRKRIAAALSRRPGVLFSEELRSGKTTACYRLADV